MKTKFEGLKKSLFEKTGIKFEDYQNEELADKVSSIAVFPLYAIKAIMIPVLIMAGLNLFITIGAIFEDSIGNLSVIILLLIGTFIAILLGLFHGLRRFVIRLSSDLKDILILSLKLAEKLVSDIGDKIEAKIRSSQESTSELVQKGKIDLPPIPEIFSGVVFIIVLPMLTRIAKRRVPLVGTVVASIISKVFDSMYPVVEKMLQENSKVATLQNIAADTNEKVEALSVKVSDGVDSKSEKALDVLRKYSTEGIAQLKKVINMAQSVVSGVVKRVIKPIGIIEIVIGVTYILVISSIFG